MRRGPAMQRFLKAAEERLQKMTPEEQERVLALSTPPVTRAPRHMFLDNGRTWPRCRCGAERRPTHLVGETPRWEYRSQRGVGIWLAACPPHVEAEEGRDAE